MNFSLAAKLPKPEGSSSSQSHRSSFTIPKLASHHLAGPSSASRSLLGGDDADQRSGRADVEITGFDAAAGGAIDANEAAIRNGRTRDGALVIPKLDNRDWRNQGRQQTKEAGPGRGQGAESVAGAFDGKDGEMQYGLTIMKSKQSAKGEADDGSLQHVERAMDEGSTSMHAVAKSEDELALEALANKDESKSALVVAAATTEADAYHREYDKAPEMASIEAYDRVPVEEFGAALLRGLGWKDGQDIGRTRYDVSGSDGNKKKAAATSKAAVKRPALLGIGAKDEAAMGIELGAWGTARKASGRDTKAKVAKNPSRHVEEAYVPLMRVNRHTGERLTEDELQKKLEAQKLGLSRAGGRHDGDADDGYRKKRHGRNRDGEGIGERYEDDDGRNDGRYGRSGKHRFRSHSPSRDDGRDRSRPSDGGRRRDEGYYRRGRSRSRSRPRGHDSRDASYQRKRKYRDYDGYGYDGRDSEDYKRHHRGRDGEEPRHSDRPRERGAR